MECWYCIKHKQNVDKDTAWRAQNREMSENPIYKMVNIAQRGELLALYEQGGPSAVRQYCIQVISTYLYSGRHIIRKPEYTKWRQRADTHESYTDRFEKLLDEVDSPHVDEPDEEILSDHDYSKDKIIKFEDHEACWDLELRGAVGETALHLCYLNNTPIHKEIAKILLDIYPSLALDIYEAEEYYGESALHFAIVNGDLEAVKLLIKKGAKVNQRATGRFFLPEDQKQQRSNTTNYDGYAYYGEYPLAFAACFGHESIYDCLIRNGADPNMQDSFGNTVLHMAVIKDLPEIYSYAARHPIKKANPWIKNFYREDHLASPEQVGLIPLALASKLGRRKIFEEIMELHRVELWRYSNVNCSLYPIHAVDTVASDGKINWNSAAMITINGDTEGHSEMLQDGVIRQLLDEKWKLFVRKRFFLRLTIVVLHLIFLSTAVYLRPRKNVHTITSHQIDSEQHTKDIVRTISELLTAIGCLIAFGMQGQEIRFFGVYHSFMTLKNAPFKATYLIGCLLILIVLPIRLASYGYQNDPKKLESLQLVEEKFLAIALPMVWTMLLFFAKVTKLVGPLINIGFVYVKRELIPFLAIMAIFYVAFDVAFFIMYKTIAQEEEVTTFARIHGGMMALFHYTLGEFEFDEFQLTQYPLFTVIVFAIFMIITPILLLNMLIAMVAHTFEKFIEKSERDWICQWAKIVIILERTFSNEQLLEFQQRYSIPIDGSSTIDKTFNSSDSAEQRGLMVIKFTSKTKAKQRRDAVRNWKRTIKEVLNRIKELKSSIAHPIDVNFEMIFPEDEASILQRKNRDRETGQELLAAVQQLAWEKS